MGGNNKMRCKPLFTPSKKKNKFTAWRPDRIKVIRRGGNKRFNVILSIIHGNTAGCIKKLSRRPVFLQRKVHQLFSVRRQSRRGCVRQNFFTSTRCKRHYIHIRIFCCVP